MRTMFEITTDGIILYMSERGRINTQYISNKQFMLRFAKKINISSGVLPFMGDYGTFASNIIGKKQILHIITREHIEEEMFVDDKKFKNVLVPNLLWNIGINIENKKCIEVVVKTIDRRLNDMVLVGDKALELETYRVPFSNVYPDGLICFGGLDVIYEILPFQFLRSKFNHDLNSNIPGGINKYIEDWKNFSYEKDNGDDLYTLLKDATPKKEIITIKKEVFG